MDAMANIVLLFLALIVVLAIVPTAMAFAMTLSKAVRKTLEAPNRLYVWWISRRVESKKHEQFNIPAQNYSQLYLVDKDFHDSELPKANFEGANLHHVNFKHTNLWHANFRNCDLGEADFTDADLQEADLRNANLIKSKLERANLRGAVFNPHTRLPFTHEKARNKGMVFVA